MNLASLNSWEGLGATLSGLFGGPQAMGPPTAAGQLPKILGEGATAPGGMKLDMELLAPIMEGLMKGPEKMQMPASPGVNIRGGGQILPTQLPSSNPASIRNRMRG